MADGLAVTLPVTPRSQVHVDSASRYWLDALVLLRVAIVACVFGCSGASVRTAFHPSDPSFRAMPGTAPRAYLEDEIAAVPQVRMRSVGLIEVMVPASSGIPAAVEAAVEKGRELGCWILVEHSAFGTLQSQTLPFGARVYLAHGGGGGGGGQGTPSSAAAGAQASDGTLTAEFDCVMQANISSV